MRDDLGAEVALPRPPRRLVSLVPSLTEAVAASAPGLLVGASDWCSHPADLDVRRVRGTKNPDRAAILDLAPDLVLANQEENRELDVRRLRDAGVAVWVTRIESVADAITSLGRVLTDVLDLGVPPWWAEVVALWDGPAPDPVARVAVPIWRRPWMVVGRSTFTGDLLGHAGLANAFEDAAGRYPAVERDEIDRPDVDLVLLPNEPYVFSATDGPEAFARPTRLVSGRLLTWYGPSLLEAGTLLGDIREGFGRPI